MEIRKQAKKKWRWFSEWEAAILDSPWLGQTAQELCESCLLQHFFVGMCAVHPLACGQVCSEEGGTAGQQNIHLGWHKELE